jgi:hypothetical protein
MTRRRPGEFDRLLRQAMRLKRDDAILTDEDAVIAYLVGTASPEQAAEVRNALIHSASFREEFVRLAKDCEYLLSEEAQEAFDAVTVDTIPLRPRLR